MKLIFFTVLLSFSTFAQQSNSDKLSRLHNISKIAFGSCNKQFRAQTVWKDMIQQSPDLFIWGGDNIYANTKDPDLIQAAYKLQNSNPDYLKLKEATPFIGTWDDHDYGNNNEDGRYPHKKQSQKYALDFLEEPADSPRRQREGIYTSYSFGESGKKIKIILLDNRYFKNLDSTFPMLGKQQWRWLESEIIESDANLLLIVGGLSILSPQNSHAEEWEDYAFERARLSAFLQARKIPYLYLTGDKHFSSIFRRDKELEFLSSGMTHNTRIPMRAFVRARYPNPFFVNNYGLIEVSWNKTAPELSLKIRSSIGQDMITKKVRWENDLWKDI